MRALKMCFRIVSAKHTKMSLKVKCFKVGGGVQKQVCTGKACGQISRPHSHAKMKENKMASWSLEVQCISR